MAEQSGDSEHLSATTEFVSGDGRVLSVDDIADTYRNCVNLAIPESGTIQKLDDQNLSLTCRFRATDCDSLEHVTTSKTYFMSTTMRNKERCIESVRCVSEHHSTFEGTIVTSNNNRFTARLKKTDDNKQFLQIWDRRRLLKVVTVTEDTQHGLINTDQTFSGMSWYPFEEQDKLIYVCQSKRPKSQSFFKQSKPKADEEGHLGDRLYVDDWGEGLNGIEHTMVAVLDVGDDCKIRTIEVSNHSLADVKWLDGMRSLSVAYEEEPKRIGVIYCNNRRSHLVVHDWSNPSPEKVSTLKREGFSYHTPRVDHSGKRFVYLVNQSFGPHRQSSRMRLHDLNTNQDQELADTSSIKKDLFLDKLADDCFTADDQHILFVDLDVVNKHLCLFDLSRSIILRIKFPTTGLHLLDFRHDVILAAGSELNSTPTIFVATLSPKNPGELVAWHQIEDSIHLEEIDYESSKIPTSDGASFLSTLLLTPSVDLLHTNFKGTSVSQKIEQADLPTLVLVHGGPNSAFISEYMTISVFLCRLGLKVLFINYRGSTGVSQDYIDVLSGKVGELDVSDCLHAIRHHVTAKQINPNKLIIWGGSHGGFLACHLSCQEEFKFTSAIIRNPVVDISSMVSTTDIPDWCGNFALGHDNYNFGQSPNVDELTKMYQCSPISRYSQANVPTLMMLGSNDKRISMFQGMRWYELLKARGIKTKCKVYADKHDLSKAATSADSHMSVALWILSNLK